jgi:RNA polymerase sigma factor (sigma-70 family)
MDPVKLQTERTGHPVGKYMPDSDQELIRACRQGNPGAWQRVLDKYERLVFSIPLHYGLDREDAADIAQLTFTSLVQDLDRLREDSRLGAWLNATARRHTWRLVKSRRRQIPTDIEDEELEASAAVMGKTDPNSIDRWQLTEWLDHSLSQMDERCANCLVALYFDTEEPSYTEAATRLGMPVGSIGPTRARCLERMKKIMQSD